MQYLWIALGSALGGVSRFALGSWILERYGGAFPWGTLVINMLGSGLIGLFATSVKTLAWRQFLMIGVCGGFTTFSTFSLEALQLLREGNTSRALAYVTLSVCVCLVSVWAGYVAGTALSVR